MLPLLLLDKIRKNLKQITYLISHFEILAFMKSTMLLPLSIPRA